MSEPQSKEPLLKLLEESLSEMSPEMAQAVQARDIPQGRALAELESPKLGDPNELIRYRFLSRGGTALFVGPTGVGKSSFLMQAAILWSLGRPCFEILPSKALRIVIVQAENDEGDLAEMRDGVACGLGLCDEERQQAFERVRVYSDSGRTGEKFSMMLDAILAEEQAGAGTDLLVIDPAFAYLGGDANKQDVVSRFMREWIQPLAIKYQVGILIIHHTNKPPRGTEKGAWSAGDFAYLGAGSAEWINPARAALAIRSIGSDSIFELRAPKRGKRLGWKDENGEATMVRYIAHDRGEGVICWREADPEEVAELLGETGDSGARVPRSVVSVLVAVKQLGEQATHGKIVRLLQEMTRVRFHRQARRMLRRYGQGPSGAK